jgi:type IV pilus assembly protein PilC
MPADRDLAVFYRSLAEMVRAGVIGSAALEACAHFLPDAGQAARFVEQGRPLSEALSRFPRIFPAHHVRLLQVAERTGSVDATLSDLADYAAEMTAARRTVVSGLTLPAFVLHLAAIITPLPGLILGHTSLPGYLWAVGAPLAVLWAIAGAIVFFARRAPPETLDAVLQRLPAAGGAWRELQRWHMASALRMLARTSLDVPSSLRFAASVCHDAPVARALRHAAATTEQTGTPASSALQATGALPADVIALWRNAELTGSHDAMFARLAARHAETFRAQTQAIATWFPRIVYGLVALAVIFQIFDLAGPYLGAVGAAAR